MHWSVWFTQKLPFHLLVKHYLVNPSLPGPCLGPINGLLHYHPNQYFANLGSVFSRWPYIGYRSDIFNNFLSSFLNNFIIDFPTLYSLLHFLCSDRPIGYGTKDYSDVIAPAVIDCNLYGTIYLGQVWRLAPTNFNSAPKLINGGTISALGELRQILPPTVAMFLICGVANTTVASWSDRHLCLMISDANMAAIRVRAPIFISLPSCRI